MGSLFGSRVRSPTRPSAVHPPWVMPPSCSPRSSAISPGTWLPTTPGRGPGVVGSHVPGETADERGEHDGGITHGGCTALGLVGLRTLDPNKLPITPTAQQPDDQ